MTFQRRLAAAVAPFAATAMLGFAIVPIDNQVDWTAYSLAAAVAVAVGGLSVLAPWSALPRATRLVPSLLFLVALALLRDAGGGVAAGVGGLALLPVFWLALHGSRAELLMIMAGASAFFAYPLVLADGANYPTGSWRMGIVFVAAAAIVGVAVQNLVARVRSHAEELATRERDLEAMADLARELSGAPDAREDICVAARELSGADFAFLLEVKRDGTLTQTAGAGLDPAVFARRQEPAAILSEPVHRGEEAVGDLVVGWWRSPSDRRRTTVLLRLLAAEAAFVIERADLLGRLTEIALTDELTGVPNRRAWDKRLEAAIRGAEPVCVAILDLDFFKAFNDDHGHQAGDRLLKEAAAAWRAELRETDMLARYGGEEFGILLAGEDLQAARLVVDRVLAATPRGQSCSAGLACREAGEDSGALLGRADAALYEAKRAGRNRTQVSARPHVPHP
jgi:diguanylate cyclase (GGDEF)-like protein